jgi:hypothetical protein
MDTTLKKDSDHFSAITVLSIQGIVLKCAFVRNAQLNRFVIEAPTAACANFPCVVIGVPTTPKAFNNHSITTITTTTFRMVLILPSMGI